MTIPQHTLFLADRSGDYLRSYSIDVHLARHAIELGRMDRADRLIQQAQVSLWLATDCIDQFNAVMDALESPSTGAEVIPFAKYRQGPKSACAPSPRVLLGVSDRYDPLPPCDVEG